MLTHDVAVFAGGLSAKLATRSRHVCTFFGAGTSKACGLPDVVELTNKIAGSLKGDQLASFKRITKSRSLEGALSRLRRIEAVAEGSDTIDGLTKDSAKRLDLVICKLIIRELSLAEVNMGPADRFASWVARADYLRPVEIFTVNYDSVLESALEAKAIPYFDGFMGTWQARFRTDMVEATNSEPNSLLPSFFARLWKLHGSINWAWDNTQTAEQVIRLGAAVPESAIAAIFPSDTKYEESRRMPFVVLQDRLRRALSEPETLFLVSGYSWADEHLNELFFEAAARRPRSEIIAFCYSGIAENLAEKAAQTPNLQVVTQVEAIIGGVRANWGAPDGDTRLPADIWDGSRCGLGDFGKLTSFLSRSSSVIDRFGPSDTSEQIYV
ncbi:MULTISPECIES: SIR2 family protein [unclassified Curtobacterium]|uniref:SIR2 family protein n=1 Tax=unclassified Curtobacterium TaxID=257496 RepID=UPI000DA81518|nr:MULTISPECIES: SIR2 family protein [unclassified Curtobacterium]PZF36995.1 SIR2 family protein [Curtobacterium sp. MCLR17_053]PZF46314.1 SIR2 family protein [Curtobacterium sp. MCLR17_051]